MKKLEAIKILEAKATLIDEEIKKMLLLRGHNLTGKLLSSIGHKKKGNKIVGTMLEKGKIVNDGLKPNQVPDKGSKDYDAYYRGLVSYFKKRGYSDKEAKRFAFNTWKKHRKEGMSTIASRRFSKDGKRNKFFDDAIANVDKEQIEKDVMLNVAQYIKDNILKGKA